MYIKFEIFLANLSFIILFISMLVYWFQATNIETLDNKKNISLNVEGEAYETPGLGIYSACQGQPNQEHSNKPAKQLMSSLKGTSVPLEGLLIFLKNFGTAIRLTVSRSPANFKSIGSVGMLISNLSLFILLVLRWTESGHFPLSNLYESLMFLSWSLTFIHLFIEFIYNSSYSFSSIKIPFIIKDSIENESADIRVKQPVASKQKRKILINNLIGSITAPSALFTNAFATFSLPKEMQESSPLVPALQSNWLMMHVTVMILSYAALILGSLLSIGFLVIVSRLEITNNVPYPSFEPQLPISSNDSSVFTHKNQSLLLEIPETKNATETVGRLQLTGLGYQSVSAADSSNSRLNLAKTLDNLSYRILGLGFPLLTIGILSGAVWANEAWGSYWSWDPKETWALLTWLVFAIYLHTRLTKGWEGKKPALIASLGFITVWICFLGVNLIGEGLHSYGWVS
jgi:cytochrome c-type biogenesis protein CcsB